MPTLLAAAWEGPLWVALGLCGAALAVLGLVGLANRRLRPGLVGLALGLALLLGALARLGFLG